MTQEQIGTELDVGTAELSGYVPQERTDGGGGVDYEDVMDNNGARFTRIIFQKDPKISLRLVATAAANPTDDFPEGSMCTVSGFTEYFVDSCRIATAKGAKRVDVDLTDIGIT